MMAAVARSTDGAYYRAVGDGPGGARRAVWLAGPEDVTAEHHGYAPGCSACWLGHGHTVAVHARAVAA